MRRIGVTAAGLLLLATVAGAEAPYEREALEQDLALELVLKTPGPIQAEAPLLADLRITNRSKTDAYPIVLPQSGCQEGVTEPYIWFTARLRPAGFERFEPVEERAPVGLCGTGSWSWHRHVRTLAPGETLEVTNRLRAIDLEIPATGTLELTAHYGFLAPREQPRLPGAEGPDDLGPMKGVPAFTLRSKPVQIEVVRTLGVRLERGPAKLRRGKAVHLSELLDARLANASGAPILLTQNGYSVWVELRAGKQGTPVDVTRKPVGALARPARTVPKGAATRLLGPKGWYDETLTLKTAPPGGVEARIVVRIEGTGAPRTVRSAWARID